MTTACGKSRSALATAIAIDGGHPSHFDHTCSEAPARSGVQRAAGESECVLRIDESDSRQPITVQAGDQLDLRCHHDNSAENQPYIDGQTAEPQDVYWGEGTTDEMCLGVFLVAD